MYETTGAAHLHQLAYEWGEKLPCGCALTLLNRENVELCEDRCHDVARLVRSRTDGPRA